MSTSEGPTTEADLGRLAALAGARVAALEDIGSDIVNLTRSVSELATSISLLATKEEVAAVDAEQDRKRRRTTALVAGGVAVAFILLLVPTIAALVLLDRLEDISTGNRANGDLLIECTTPSPAPGQARNADDEVHECFEEGQARTGAAVGAISLAVLDAALCARFQPTEEAIATCYQDRVAARSETQGEADD